MSTTPIQKIVSEYRKAQGNGNALPYRKFSEQLSKPLALLKRSISYASVQNWESGKYEPNDDDLHALVMFAHPTSWQWHFANDLKAAKYPTVHRPTGEIGKRILGDFEVVPASQRIF